MASQRMLFDSTLVRVGHFTCGPDAPHWAEDNVIRGTSLVFPTVPVVIQHAGRDPVVADRNVVMYYNEGQVYRRGMLHERGDEAFWISLSDDLWAGVVGEFEPGALDTPESPFSRERGPSPTDCYLRHRALVSFLLGPATWSALEIEEAAVALSRRLVECGSQAWHGARRRRGPETARARAAIVEEVRECLATEPGDAWTLDRLVDRVAVSPGHLCRVFKEDTGSTIHRYLSELRLREALASVMDGERNLSALAQRLGYSSHSHFTEAFRRSFGRSPRHLRDLATIERIAVDGRAA